jgi:hypothetical protein
MKFKPDWCLTIHEPRPTCLFQCSEKILNAEFAESAEIEIFTPRSPRAPRLKRLWIDGCAASFSERSLGKRPHCYRFGSRTFATILLQSF